MYWITTFWAWVRAWRKPRGRHRAESVQTAPQRRREPRTGLPASCSEQWTGYNPQPLVRPYVAAHEQRRQAQRRRILYAAVALGLDLDTRDIHTAGVAR